MKIAVGQMSVSSDKDENLGKIEAFVKQAYDAGVKLILFPETCMFRGDEQDEYITTAEAIDGPFVTSLKRLANLHSMHIVAGMYEISVDANRVYNTTVVIDNNGGLVDSYRKMHLYDAFGYQESARVIAGDGSTVVFQCDELMFGVMTCYDLRFPELARHLAYQGAHVLLLPAAWHAGPHKEAHLETLARARAIENNTYLAAALQLGDRFTGDSLIVDPMGIIQGSVADTDSLLVSEVTRDRIDLVREYTPTLKNRRADIYQRWREVRWYDEATTD